MDLSVLIVSWNTRELLDRCLWSVYETTKEISFEVIVVDNASSDGSAEMVQSKYGRVKLIENPTNTGFARANNQAITSSCGRYVLLLNPDTICHDGALQTLVAFLDYNPGAGAVAPLVLNPDGSLQHSWAAFPTLFSEAMGRLDRRVASRGISPQTPEQVRAMGQFPVDWIGGACFMARRSAVEETGPLDETLFMYCEETDWCMRLARAGWQMWVEPTAEIIHLGGQSSVQVPAETRKRLADSKLSFFRKHYGPASASILRVAFILRALVAAAARRSPNPSKGQLELARHLLRGGMK